VSLICIINFTLEIEEIIFIVTTYLVLRFRFEETKNKIENIDVKQNLTEEQYWRVDIS